MGEGHSPEVLTADPRFEVVTDKVPLISSWGLELIKPRPGLIIAAVVQRTAQLYSPFVAFQPTSESGAFLTKSDLNPLAIGLEDKLIGREPKEGTAKFFAKEGRMIRQSVGNRLPGQVNALDSLVEARQIQNNRSDLGHMQLLMLVGLDQGVASLVSRLNRNLERGPNDPAFNYRQKIYDFLRESKVPEEQLIKYTDGERRMAIPKGLELGVSSGGRSLEAELKNLSAAERKDWRFLRSALFMLSDSKVREVLEVNRQIRVRDNVNLGGLISEIKRVAKERDSVHRRS